MVDPSPPNSFGLGRGRVDVAAGMSWARPRVQGPQSNAMDEVEEGDSMEDERLCDIERESGAVRRLV